MQPSDIFNLPAGPAEICFDKNEFIKKSFSVDEFLQNHRNSGLEAMRDDLGIYLKVLRTAMIELINEDYADFVNLSSNLIGLDQSINGIQTPLGQLKEEIIMVKMTLNDTMTELSNCMEMKKSLRSNLKSVQSVTKVQESIKKLDDLLNNQLNSESISATLLERAALEFVQIDFNIQFCKDLIKEPYAPANVESLHSVLLTRIEEHFLAVLASKENEKLERCLRIFCILDECKVAEDIFKKKVVAPYMHPIISEASLQNNPQGLKSIYTQVLDFITTKMDILLALTGYSGKIKGFDFLINSFWVEVERRLETHMASIFAPGNPDMFYQKYQHTNNFLTKLESKFGHPEGVRQLKTHQQYTSFHTRWNLPVYFQIRFQEIGGALEMACSRPISKSIFSTKADVHKLIPFSVAMECIRKCWSEGIYLPQIFMRFWKLTLQIISRLTEWVAECTALKNWTDTEYLIVDFFVFLYLDIERFIGEVPAILRVSTANLPTVLHNSNTELEKCLKESTELFRKKLIDIRQRIVKEILTNSCANIKQVTDIPRLYRKTNREIPSKACSYVDQILEPPRQFTQKYGKDISAVTINDILTNIFSDLNRQYYSAINDVLTSVQKTEESLRRLKNLREKSSNLSNTSSSNLDRMGMTDDDKIRLQLQVDVIHWSEGITQLGVQQTQVDQLFELINLVEESTKLKVSK